VEGRTADDAAYWLAQATPAWRDAAIDMCSIYASAVRRMLPGAQIAVDLFHVVHLTIKMTGDVRRRVARGKYGRRGRSGDPEYGIKNLLVRNLEHLSGAQFAKIMDTLNRLARLEARLAYGFRNPANQRRRVRIACTRGQRRQSRTATSRRTRRVNGRKHNPG
jgi:transposase